MQTQYLINKRVVEVRGVALSRRFDALFKKQSEVS